MKVASLAAILLGALLAGCATGGDPANPNLLAPKVLLRPDPDGNVTVYVHSAFGEYDYDWLTLAVDNATLVNRMGAFSLEERIPATSFFLTVRAGASDRIYEVQGHVEVDAARQRARVTFLDASGDWDDPRTYSLPLEHILDRVSEGS